VSGPASAGLEAGILRVRENETVRFRPGRKGLALRAVRGTFLVTQEGDLEDHVLEGEGEFRTGSRGLVVAWAFVGGALGAREAA
jgi:hypothetical protein